jgi:chromate transport protein ChrA
MHPNHHGDIDLAEPLCGFLAAFWVTSVVLAIADVLVFRGGAPLPLVLSLSGCVGLFGGWIAYHHQQTGEWRAPWNTGGKAGRRS